MQTVEFHSKQSQQLGEKAIRFASLRIWSVVGAHEFLVALAPREYNHLSIIDVARSLQKIVIHATKMCVDRIWPRPGVAHLDVIFLEN